MEIHFYAKTDVGRVRNTNEDFYLSERISEDEYLFCVADGMGGHLAGDVASRMACEKFREYYKSYRKKKLDISEVMELAIRKANQTILKKAENDPMKRGMGTTFSAVVILNMTAFIIHIGDSRIYLIRNNQIKRLTTDHTFVEKLVENGRISQEEAREHPQKNVLYMSLGAREGFFPEIIRDIRLNMGDAVVLCSDGLNNMINDQQIKETVLNFLPQEAAEELVRLANAHGGNDNITLQIIRIGTVDSLEKTKPIKNVSKNRFSSMLILLGMALLLLASWVLFRSQPESKKTVSTRNINAASNRTESRKATGEPVHDIIELSENGLNDMNITASPYCRLQKNQLLIQNQRDLWVVHLGLSLRKVIPLQEEESVLPAFDGNVFFFRASRSSRNEFHVFQDHTGSRPIRTFFIQQEKIIPLFFHNLWFLFSDGRRIYSLKNINIEQWRSNTPFPIDEIVLSEPDQVYIQRLDREYVLIYFGVQKKSIQVFNLQKNLARVGQWNGLAMNIPLALEYRPGPVIRAYFSDYSLEWKKDSEKPIRRGYRFSNYKAQISRILIDTETRQKLMIADNAHLYRLEPE